MILKVGQRFKRNNDKNCLAEIIEINSSNYHTVKLKILQGNHLYSLGEEFYSLELNIKKDIENQNSSWKYLPKQDKKHD